MTTHARRRPVGDAVRRAIDVIVAATGLVVTSPLSLAIAVAVRVSMGRPVLFRQRRSGLDGAEFTIIKFRTMRDPKHPGEPDLARTTRLGSLLRATSLDELPQLWNVLRGDMSLIGPRPCIPYEYENYSTPQRARFHAQPGLTGLWQVSGKNRTTFDRMIELDIQYAAQRSLWLDIKILLLTVPAVLSQVLDMCRSRWGTAREEAGIAAITAEGKATKKDSAIRVS